MAEPALSRTDIDTAGLAVRLRAVTKVYDNGVAALGPLDLDVAKGEFVSLLGPSGCGKSTALRLIAGLSAPSAGIVNVSHRATKADGRHPIGFVFQEPTLDAVGKRARKRAPAAETCACVGGRYRPPHRGGAGAGRSCRICRRIPPGIVRRYEDAGLAGARARYRSRIFCCSTSRSRRSTRSRASGSTTICLSCGASCTRPSSSSPIRCSSRSICRSGCS